MSVKKLLYVGQSVADSLLDNVDDNIERYRSGDFEDLVAQGNWEIATELTYDSAPLNDLNPARTAEAEKQNSVLVWRALREMTPALATENRVWVRFTHLDCLDFCRQRWLDGQPESKHGEAIRTHFFANTRTRWRDDNAISRLWWNYCIARRLMPDDPVKALDIIFHVLDMRLSTVERPGLFIRPKIAAGILRTFAADEWVLGSDKRWRDFMKVLNKLGAGRVFEVMSDVEVDRLMAACLDRTKSIHA